MFLVCEVIQTEDDVARHFPAVFRRSFFFLFGQHVVANLWRTIRRREVRIRGDQAHGMILERHQFHRIPHGFIQVAAEHFGVREILDLFQTRFPVFIALRFQKIPVPEHRIARDDITFHGTGQDIRPLADQIAGFVAGLKIVVRPLRFVHVAVQPVQVEEEEAEQKQSQNTGYQDKLPMVEFGTQFAKQLSSAFPGSTGNGTLNSKWVGR